MAVIINLFNVFACSLYDRCSRNMYDDLSLLLCLALPNDSQSRLLLPHMHIEEMLFLTVLIVSAAFLQQGFVPLHLRTCMYILHLHPYSGSCETFQRALPPTLPSRI